MKRKREKDDGDGKDKPDPLGPVHKKIMRTHQRNLKKKAKPKIERGIFELQSESSYGYEHTNVEYGKLETGFHRGWGGQPFLHGGIDYDTIVSRIESSGIAEYELAEAVLAKIDDRTDDYLDTLTSKDEQLREALYELIVLTQVIESHDSRAPGWDKVARGLLSAILNSGVRFRSCFNRVDGAFLPAWRKKAGAVCGGQEAVRAFMELKRKKSDNSRITYTTIKAEIGNIESLLELKEQLSESSEEES